MLFCRRPSRTKIGKAWFSSATEEFAFFTKNHPKNNCSSTSEWWQYTKSCFEENARTFSKNSTNQENTRISRLKQAKKLLKKRKFQTRNKTNDLDCKQAEDAKFCAKLDSNLRAKNALKLFSKYLKDKICKIK